MSYISDILSPEDVISIMPSSIKKSWIYSHWEDLGGIRIGKRLFILKEVLYANFQGKRLVVRKDRKEWPEVDSEGGGNEKSEVEEEERSQARRSRVKAASGAIKNYSNEFGLVDALQ